MRTSMLCILAVTLLWGCSGSPNQNSSISSPSGVNSQYPYLFSTNDKVYMSWVSKIDSSSHSLEYASYDGTSWSSPQIVASGSNWFVNWADFPSIIADENGPMAAHWLHLENPGPLAYDIKMTTADGDEKWGNAFIPHNDGTSSEHGFVSMIPWQDDTFLAVWLDGRQTEGRTGQEYYNINYAMTLRGAIVNTKGEVQKRFIIDESVCDCCPTSLVKTGNTAIVAYRNRTAQEVRDIYVSRFDGKKWSNPQAVHNDNWEIGACPVNGPKVVARDSTVAVAWHTGASPEASAKIALSSDVGRNFDTPITLNQQESIGRVDAALNQESVFVSWIEKDINKATLQLASINRNSKQITTQSLSSINQSRSTGFPQMEILGNQLFFAWTKVDSTAPKIKMRSISLPLSRE